MKAVKWLAITMAAAVAVGGVMMLKARAAETAPLRAGPGRFLSRAVEKLGLSPDQVAKIKAELSGEKDALTGILNSLHDARIALRETIQKPDASETEIRAAAAKAGAVEADLAVERAKLYGKISPMLTADQLAKVNEFQQRVDDFVDGAIAAIGKRLAE
jgi:Spy/CpxP family protein refolding chaperone